MQLARLYQAVCQFTHTLQQKYKALAKKALARIVMFEREMCSYNFYNKTKLLQTEVSHLNRKIVSADMAYKL